MTSIVYNSPHFYVAEITGTAHADGIEIVDKFSGRGGYLQGEVAAKLRESLQLLTERTDCSPILVDDAVEEFLWYCNTIVVYH